MKTSTYLRLLLIFAIAQITSLSTTQAARNNTTTRGIIIVPIYNKPVVSAP